MGLREPPPNAFEASSQNKKKRLQVPGAIARRGKTRRKGGENSGLTAEHSSVACPDGGTPTGEKDKRESTISPDVDSLFSE